MAIKLEKTSYGGKQAHIWRGECKVLPGGFQFSDNLPAGTIIEAGTPIHIDTADLTATLPKYAATLAQTTATAVRVKKGHLFAKGDTICAKTDADGTEQNAEIDNIDTTATDYDTLKLKSTGLAGISAPTDASTNAGIGICTSTTAPNAVAAADFEIPADNKGFAVIDAAYEAVLLKDTLPEIPSSWLLGGSGIGFALNPNIILINQ